MNLITEAAIVGLLVLAGLLAGAYVGYTFSSSRDEAKFQAHLALDRQADETAQRAARIHEFQLGVAANTASESYEQGKKDAEVEYQKTVSDLLDGSLRLQNRWAGCEASRASEATASAGKLDAAARDRAQSAGRIIAAADACDAQIRGLQAVLVSERR